MSKPPFDPNQPFDVVDAGNAKPAFDPSKPFDVVPDNNTKSVSGFGKNLLSDAADNIHGAISMASQIEPTMAVLQGENPFSPKRPIALAKGLYEGAKQLPAQLWKTARHPINSMYERPISTGMDIATVAGAGASGLKALIPNAEKTAQNLALKAFGDTKRFTNNPIKEAMARKSVQTLMDEGVLRPWSTTEGLMERTSKVADSAGEAIGKHLETVGQSGKFFNPQEAISEIEKLRPKTESGQILETGAYKPINDKIDRAIETIKAHAPSDPNAKFENIVDSVFGKSGPGKPIPEFAIGWEEANKLKGTIQDLANWKSNKDATVLDRVIAGKFRESLDKALEKVTADPLKHQEFLKNKRIYSAAMNQMDPLYNRLSSELGNKGISLTDWILAASHMGAGNPLTAVATVGGKKLLERFGPQTGATFLNKVGRIPAGASGRTAGVGILMNAARKNQK